MEIDMKDFRNIWKTLHANKTITCRDVIQHCILRAMYSKSDTEAVLKHLLHKAFTPRINSSEPFYAIEHTNATIGDRYFNNKLLGQPVEEILETQEEIDEFNSWANVLRKPGKLVRNYSYFFTRQDISPEYQLVQTAHAALELGNKLKPEQIKDLYFTCCGLANLQELYMIQGYLDNHGIEYIAFREPDIGNEITSIAVHPIAENKRGILRNYKLLTFNIPQTIEVTSQTFEGEKLIETRGQVLIKENK
jgi:hypothetical protein